MRAYRCFYSDPAHQISQVRDIPAQFPGLRGHNICCFIYLHIKSTVDRHIIRLYRLLSDVRKHASWREIRVRNNNGLKQ